MLCLCCICLFPHFLIRDKYEGRRKALNRSWAHSLQANPHGQEIPPASRPPRTHLLGLRPLLPGLGHGLRQWLQPYPAPHRDLRRGSPVSKRRPRAARWRWRRTPSRLQRGARWRCRIFHRESAGRRNGVVNRPAVRERRPSWSSVHNGEGMRRPEDRRASFQGRPSLLLQQTSGLPRSAEAAPRAKIRLSP